MAPGAVNMSRTPSLIWTRRAGTSVCLATLLMLTGCASKKEPSLYGWKSYEKNLDAYFRADKTSPDEQLKVMEDERKLIQAEGQALPPGYQAHMGLLYGRKGDAQSFYQYVQQEKEQFPESAGFMDFLVRNFKKQ